MPLFFSLEVIAFQMAFLFSLICNSQPGYVIALMPSVPAMAVSTAIRILIKETHPFPPSKEGDAGSDDLFLIIDIIV